MGLNWKHILEGWRNNLFPPKELRELIRKTQEERLEICKTCPYNSTPDKINMFSTCKECGCPLKAKTACLHCQCPLNKWLLQLTKEESEEIKKNQNLE